MIQVINAYLSAAGGGSGHKGWRIYVLSNMAGGSSSRTSAGQIEFKDSGGSTISTSGATIFEGGTGSVNSAASNAFDGSPASGNPWSRVSTSGGNGAYIGALWATPQDVTQFTLTSATTGWGGLQTESILSGKLQWSDDTTTGSDGTWTDVFTFWEPCWLVGTQVSRTHPQDTTGKWKQIRFRLSAVNTRFGSVSELEYRATVGGADQCTNGVTFFEPTGINNGDPSFDNNTSTHTVFDNLASPFPAYLAYSFPVPVVLAEYQLSSNSLNDRIPKDFKIQGTNDGVTITDIDSKTGISGTIPYVLTQAV